jgi:hypothetical protein
MSPILQAFVGGICGVVVVFASLGFARSALGGRADFRFAKILVLLAICLPCGALTYMASGLILPDWDPESRIALAAILSWMIPYVVIITGKRLSGESVAQARK